MIAPLLADVSTRTESSVHGIEETHKKSVSDKIDAFFEISARGSTIAAEVRGGIAGWMTMSYILVVNPAILHIAAGSAGLGLEPLMTATALVSALASFMIGIVTNMPFGVMPGMGLNAYLTYSICKGLGVSWEKALSSSFVGGAALLLLSASGASDWVVQRMLSDHLKKAITVAIGVFQALIGFEVMGFVVRSPDTLITIGDLSPTWSNAQLYLGLAGLLLISMLLVSVQMRGAMLVGILAMAGSSWLLGIAPSPRALFGAPDFEAVLHIDFSGWWPTSPEFPGLAAGSAVILFVCLFDVAGIVNGLSATAGLSDDNSKNGRHMTVAGFGTMVAALLGTSPVVIACESSAAIIEGGRTGLAAITMSALFFASLAFAPVLCAVPRVATAVPLIIVGAFMMAPCKFIEWDNLRVALPSFLTVTVVPFTYSIHNGILAGLLLDSFFASTGHCLSPCLGPPDDDLPLQKEMSPAKTSCPPSPAEMSKTEVEALRVLLNGKLCTNGGIVFNDSHLVSPPLEMSSAGFEVDLLSDVSTAVSTKTNTFCAPTPTRTEEPPSPVQIRNLDLMC